MDFSGRVRLLARVPGELTLLDVDRDGRALLTRGNDRAGMIVLAPGEAREKDLSWLDWSVPLDLSADGKTIVFGESGEGGGPTYAAYLRGTDGSPAIRLGEGTPNSLSPDGKWVIRTPNTPSAPLFLLPTGVGEEKQLTHDELNHFRARWLPDGKRFVFFGNRPGHGFRIFVQSLEGGTAQPISPEGVDVGTLAISPDGSMVACIGPGGKGYLFPVSGGEPRAIPGFMEPDRPIGWSSDGRSLFVVHSGSPPVPVFRLDLNSGKRTLWKEFSPADPAGIDSISGGNVALDGKAYYYSYVRTISDLYLVTGLQ